MNARGLYLLILVSVSTTSCAAQPAVQFRIWTQTDSVYEYQPIVLMAEAVNTSDDTTGLGGLESHSLNFIMTSSADTFRCDITAFGGPLLFPPGDTAIAFIEITKRGRKFTKYSKYIPAGDYQLIAHCWQVEMDDGKRPVQHIRLGDTVEIHVLEPDLLMRQVLLDSLVTISKLPTGVERFPRYLALANKYTGTPWQQRALLESAWHLEWPPGISVPAGLKEEQTAFLWEYVRSHPNDAFSLVLADKIKKNNLLFDEIPRTLVGEFFRKYVSWLQVNSSPKPIRKRK